MESLDKLTKDLKAAARTLGRDEARFLVDTYYVIQDDRKRSFNQERALDKSGEPHEVISWFAGQSKTLEKEIATVLDLYSDSIPLGQWARSQIGIGPVIAAGLLAHIDIEKAPTAGHIWRFAGLDPTSKWEKGQKRPWNADLKVLCWKIGESFVKVSGNEKALYGQLYLKRKAYEIAKNEAGDYKDQAAAALAQRKIGKDTIAYSFYEKGMLPPGRIHARAKRYAVKMFLSHYHEVAYWLHFGKAPPAPYVIGIMGHVDYIPPQHFRKAA